MSFNLELNSHVQRLCKIVKPIACPLVEKTVVSEIGTGTGTERRVRVKISHMRCGYGFVLKIEVRVRTKYGLVLKIVVRRRNKYWSIWKLGYGNGYGYRLRQIFDDGYGTRTRLRTTGSGFNKVYLNIIFTGIS